MVVKRAPAWRRFGLKPEENPMPKLTFVNLAVANVAKSTAFYQALGAKRDARFCTESTSMLAFSDTIYVMLLDHRFSEFTPKPIADARETSEVLLCLSEESRASVDATTEKAIAAGGRGDPCPKQDYGFMYGRSFEDLDGHIVEVTWMDVQAALEASTQHTTAA